MSTIVSNQLKEIRQVLLENKNEQTLLSAQKFIPNAQNIIGVKMPVLNDLASKYKLGGFDLVQALWVKGIYEERMLAAKLLGKIAKQNASLTLELVEKYSQDMDNWALCDTLGMQSVKPIVKTHQAEIFNLAKKINTSNNFWQRRLSLVLLEWYTRDKSTHPFINSLIHNLKSDKEYYVKKAIVWIEKNFNKGK